MENQPFLFGWANNTRLVYQIAEDSPEQRFQVSISVFFLLYERLPN